VPRYTANSLNASTRNWINTSKVSSRRFKKSLQTTYLNPLVGCLDTMFCRLEANNCGHPENAISRAAGKANDTVLRWNGSVNSNSISHGSYCWATYKAICRRNGVYSNPQGLHDWNSQLTEPVIKAISSSWERAFSQRIPLILQATASKAMSSMNWLHSNIETKMNKDIGPLGCFPMLNSQLQNYNALFRDLCSVSTGRVATQAKDINRMFQPVIASALETAYQACCSEKGMALDSLSHCADY
jgi:hypothetical protein